MIVRYDSIVVGGGLSHASPHLAPACVAEALIQGMTP